MLGTWNKSGLPVDQANAVYGSRDKQNRIMRRISKESPAGVVCQGGHYNSGKTACKHEDIDYLTGFQGMSKEEVDAHIKPLLEPSAFQQSQASASSDNEDPKTLSACISTTRFLGGGGPIEEAKRLYQDGSDWFKAIGARKGKLDAGVEIVYIAEELTEEFRAELRRLLSKEGWGVDAEGT